MVHSGTVLTEEAHKARHLKLHVSLLELVKDFQLHTGKYEGASIQSLLDWSEQQIESPQTNRDLPEDRCGGDGTFIYLDE